MIAAPMASGPPRAYVAGMEQAMKQEPVTVLRGLDALQSALRDPSVPIFLTDWGGKALERISLEEAAAFAARGRQHRLLAEIPA